MARPVVDVNLCRAISQAERLALWNSDVPEGQRLGWACAVPYCSKREHMILTENKSAHWNRYGDIRVKIAPLEIDGFTELADFPNDKTSVSRLRSALAISGTRNQAQYSVQVLPWGGVRIIRIGTWESWAAGTESEKTDRLWHPPTAIMRPLPAHHKPAQTYLGLLFWSALHPRFIVKQPRCKVRACAHPARHGVGDYCHQHIHYFDYPISMTDNTLDRGSIFRPKEPFAPYTLAAEFLISTASLEKTLRFTVRKEIDDRHKNLGNDEKSTRPTMMQKMGSRIKMRRHKGSHSSSKTTKGRRKASARQGKGGRHSDKTRRWTRESLELEANLLLGEKPLEIECNFLPPDEREADGEMYEYSPVNDTDIQEHFMEAAND